MKKLIIFDLDGTLTESKADMTSDIAVLLCQLLARTKVAVISGGAMPQFQKQFLSHLSCTSENLSQLVLLPTNGSEMFVYDEHNWQIEYDIKLSREEKDKIIQAINESLGELNWGKLEKLFGNQIEDRGSEITFSGLGQNAPLELKNKWDPDRSKRLALSAALQARIPEFEITVGGITSVDVTKKGINKAFAIDQLHDRLKIGKKDMLYVGDALFKGGNDYVASLSGVESVSVKGPVDTARVIQDLLAYNKLA